MIELPTDLPADLVPLSWLIGVWEGSGVIDYETDGHHFTGELAQRVSFSHDGTGALNYSGQAWLVGVDEQNEATTRTPLVSEVGYWRLARPATDTDPGPGLLPPVRQAEHARTADDVEALRNANDGFDLEVSLVHSDGISELYLGQVKGARIDLATDAVVRTAGAKHYAAATRMLGFVEGDLLWAWDIAALGSALDSHASARLSKVQ